MLNKVMFGNPLNTNTKPELLKLMNNKTLDEIHLFENMIYLNETIFKTLRDKIEMIVHL